MRIPTCEQVSDGHPDKICDQISDAVVTDCLQHDPFGTNHQSPEFIERIIREGYDLTPRGINKFLRLTDVDYLSESGQDSKKSRVHLWLHL